MTTGALIILVVSVLLVGLFGLFIGFTAKKQDDEKLEQKDEWAESEVEMISNKIDKA